MTATTLKKINITQFDKRLQQLLCWSEKNLGTTLISATPLQQDASFRRYCRIQTADTSYIIMDSPPDLEPCDCFLNINTWWEKNNIPVPHIYHANKQLGFLILTDFSDNLLLDAITSSNATQLYSQCLQHLTVIQQLQNPNELDFNYFDYDEFLKELLLFQRWYIETHLNIRLDDRTTTILHETFDIIIENLIHQPYTVAHRDYHSRNLMVQNNHTIGIIDHQDALLAPITYDAASLLRDLYIDWPPQKVEQWLSYYHNLLLEKRVLTEENPNIFRNWFDWSGIQRHLKAIFIFSRKYYRDQDSSYLQYIPRGLRYIEAMLIKTPELKPFYTFLKQYKILP